MKTVKITVCNKSQMERALYAQQHLQVIAYALNDVAIEIETGDSFDLDTGDDDDYNPDYITLMNFIQRDEGLYETRN